MKAESVVLAAIGALLCLGLYASYEGVTALVTMFTYTEPSLMTRLAIVVAIPATYLLVFGRGIDLGTVPSDSQQ
jgi:hypothetical protein